jgi:CRISPR/Cas system CMR-associated protein Cmr5 small subunit
VPTVSLRDGLTRTIAFYRQYSSHYIDDKAPRGAETR